MTLPRLRLAPGLRPFQEPVTDERLVDSCLVMTLLLLILYGEPAWHLRIPTTALAILGLLHRPLRHGRGYWFAITCVILAGLWQRWLLADNHKFLLGYWCLAICLSVETRCPLRALGRNARSLLALVFTLAALAKLLAPDYLSQEFFAFSMLFDARFEANRQILGGLPPGMGEVNRAAQDALFATDSTLTEIEVAIPRGIRGAALFATLWTIGLEALIATVFLGSSRRFERLRDPLLLTFILTTYAVAPVAGFGWLLVVLGLAQSWERTARVRGLYLGSFLILVLYQVPFEVLARGLP